MARYYFNVREHGVLSEDREGAELASDHLAYEEAIQAAREIISEKILQGAVIDGQIFEIMNDAGDVIQRIPLRSVIRFE